MMPRTRSRKCVSGRSEPIHCAHSGMPRNGNMKPESRIEGRKKNVICIAWSWLRAMEENMMPSVKLAAMKIKTTKYKSRGLPCIGTWKRASADLRLHLLHARRDLRLAQRYLQVLEPRLRALQALAGLDRVAAAHEQLLQLTGVRRGEQHVFTLDVTLPDALFLLFACCEERQRKRRGCFTAFPSPDSGLPS